MTFDKHLMTPGDAARVLGISIVWLRTFDDELEPIRLSTGHRRYDPSKVAKLAKARERSVRAGA